MPISFLLDTSCYYGWRGPAVWRYANFQRKPIIRTVLIYYTQGGSPHTCTGAVVGTDSHTTDNVVEGIQNLVWTAGRCIHDGASGWAGWSSNVFVCAVYLNGTNAPGGTPDKGCWVWEAESTTMEWYLNNWESRDYGVIFLSNRHYAYETGSPLTPYDITRASAAPAASPCGAAGTTCMGTFNFAYNQPRDDVPGGTWWISSYHHPEINTGPNAPAPGPDPADLTTADGTINLVRANLRVTQTAFQITHAPLPSLPAGATADTGPLVNSVGAWQDAGYDLYPRCIGSRPKGDNCDGTGAPWILNWQKDEQRFFQSQINSNTSYACNAPQCGTASPDEDDRYNGMLQGPYFDTITCYDFQAWSGSTDPCV